MRKAILTAVAAAVLVAPAGAVAKKDDGEKASASKACRLERDAIGKENFAEKYGTNRNGRNAFGRCVSQTRRENEREDEQAAKNASKECKAEREADPAAFNEKYGSNRNGRNALGKCVSQKVREAEEEQEAEDEAELKAQRQCRAEQKADEAAFDEKYGTNRNDRNAFGKCVSQKVRDDAV